MAIYYAERLCKLRFDLIHFSKDACPSVGRFFSSGTEFAPLADPYVNRRTDTAVLVNTFTDFVLVSQLAGVVQLIQKLSFATSAI